MASGAEFFTRAHDVNVAQSTFNAAGGHIYNSYYNHSQEESVLATLRPIERGGFTHECMEGTRRDILQKINGWLDDFAAPNILLLSGSPGAGKSTIAATIVSNLYSMKRLGSSFAFKQSDTGLSDPGAVWRTIASDLTRFYPGVKDSLVRILKGVDPGIADIGLQFRRLIEEPLMENRDQLTCKPPIIVLDALDECGLDSTQSDQRRMFLDTLTKWSSLSPIFKLIVTSRNERLPPSFRKVCTPIVLQTGNRVNTEAENDVRHFFRTRFDMISEEYPSLSEWPGESKIEQLTRRAAGLFIWADTVIRFVDNGECPPDEQLDLVLAGEVGEGEDVINGLYKRILDISLKGLKAHVLKASEAVLGTIVLAKVPLFRRDLAHFLPISISEQVIDFILNKLSSVILMEENDKRIYVCHLSFVDFICNPTRSSKYSVDRATQSANFATACFQLMKVGLKFNICDLKTSHLRNVDVPDLQTTIQRCISIRLSYACRFGWQHLRDSPREGSTHVELLKSIGYFLHDQLLYWLEVMSLTNEIPSASSALLSMVQWIGTSDTAMAAFSADAAKFVMNFAIPISESAPHIYLSALPWSPRKSIMAQHFLPNYPNTLSVLTMQDNDWPASLNVLMGHTSLVSSVRFSPDGIHVVSGSYDDTIRIWNSATGEVAAGPFEGHTRAVTSVEFSPDGKRVVSGSYDSTVRIWDVVTGEVAAGPFEGHSMAVMSVGFSPDGMCVVSGSGDPAIRIWNAATGEVVAGPFEGHTGRVCSVSFSPDGKCIVSGSFDNTIRIWDAATGEVVAGPFEGHSMAVMSVGFSPDGMCVVSGSDDSTIRIWDAATGGLVAGPFEGHSEGVRSAVFSPDGKRVVSGSDDQTIRIWDVVTSEVVAGPFEGHTREVSSVSFSPDGKCVVSGSFDNTIRIWDAGTGEAVAGPFEGRTEAVSSVGFSSNRMCVVSGSFDNTVQILDAVTGEVVAGPFEGHTEGVSSAGFSPDGKRVVSGSDDNTIRIWDAATGGLVAGPFEGHSERVRSVGFSQDGTRVVSGSFDSTVRIWDAATGEVIAGPFEGHTSGVSSVSFSPDGKCVISGSLDGTIQIWDAATGEVVAGPFERRVFGVSSAGFSPDGMRVVSGSFDHKVLIWDAATGEVIAGPFEGHTQTVNSVSFAPDGMHVVSGSFDNTIRIWNAGTGEAVAGPFEGHTAGVNSVGFSPDGMCVVSGAGDQTIRIWDVVTGEVVAGPFEGHTEGVNSVGFSPDGMCVVSGSYDGTVRIWDTATSEDVACPSEDTGKHVSRLDGDMMHSWPRKHQGTFQHWHFDFRSGWMKTHDGLGLLFWVPHRHRGHVCGTDTITIMGGKMTRVDLSTFVHGDSWVDCRF